ncbi:hypothetical protein J6590_096029 [Homalodisca vitripennis]|nr:hypothetical protein J6590_096029 [Homalodisca vitripennis]
MTVGGNSLVISYDSALRPFLDQEGCRSVVEFWLTATAFQSQLRPDSDPTASQNEAINIYDK